MQTQDASTEFLYKLWPWLEANKNRLIGAGVVIVVVAGIYYFINWHAQQKQINAGVALTQLLVSPPSDNNLTTAAKSLSKFASQYSGTAAAQRAELQSGASYFDLGRYADAEAQFKKFLNSDVSGPLAATAELGYAASLEAQHKLDEAASAYSRVTSGFANTACALPAECALGRIAEEQGKWNEALTHYGAVARNGNAGGTLAQEAAVHYSEIRARLAAAQKNTNSEPAGAGMKAEVLQRIAAAQKVADAEVTNSKATNSAPNK